MPERCLSMAEPVPVIVHDTLDGAPETVARLCPDCTYPVALWHVVVNGVRRPNVHA